MCKAHVRPLRVPDIGIIKMNHANSLCLCKTRSLWITPLITYLYSVVGNNATSHRKLNRWYGDAKERQIYRRFVRRNITFYLTYSNRTKALKDLKRLSAEVKIAICCFVPGFNLTILFFSCWGAGSGKRCGTEALTGLVTVFWLPVMILMIRAERVFCLQVTEVFRWKYAALRIAGFRGDSRKWVNGVICSLLRAH